MLVPGGNKNRSLRKDDEMPCGSVVDAARDTLYCPPLPPTTASTTISTTSASVPSTSSSSAKRPKLPRPAPRAGSSKSITGHLSQPTPKPRSGILHNICHFGHFTPRLDLLHKYKFYCNVTN